MTGLHSAVLNLEPTYAHRVQIVRTGDGELGDLFGSGVGGGEACCGLVLAGGDRLGGCTCNMDKWL